LIKELFGLVEVKAMVYRQNKKDSTIAFIKDKDIRSTSFIQQ